MNTPCDPHPFSVSFPGLIGRSRALRQALERCARVAPTRLPVLVLGESGTGKELVARGLHALGPNPGGPLCTINCGALPRELAESELFGHERGAFTGSGERRAGWFEAAGDGTLVLDEVGELPLDLQPKLLRVLESGRFCRVGGRAELTARARVVALTNRPLADAARAGQFRLDLYHRLAAVEIRLPPLRARRDDVPLLAAQFVAEWCAEAGLPEPPAPPGADVLAPLAAHAFEGNVRELRNLIRRALLLGGVPLSPAALHAELGLGATGPHGQTADRATGEVAYPVTPAPRGAAGCADAGAASEPAPPLLDLRGMRWPEIERASYRYALAASAGSVRGAARLLGLSRSTFHDRVRRAGLLQPATR